MFHSKRFIFNLAVDPIFFTVFAAFKLHLFNVYMKHQNIFYLCIQKDSFGEVITEIKQLKERLCSRATP